MLKACAKPMLEHIAMRLAQVKKIDQIVFATTTNAQDDCIEKLAADLGVGCFRGSEDDVLRRVLLAAKAHDADIIVEITGDCPLIDPEITAQTIDLYLSNPCHYVANDLTLSFPLGMDVQVFSTDLLEIADKEGVTPPDREHVSWYFIRNPERFRLLNLPAPPSLYWPELRLTLDEADDYRLILAVFEALYPASPVFGLNEIVAYLKKNENLLELNAHVRQRSPH